MQDMQDMMRRLNQSGLSLIHIYVYNDGEFYYFMDQETFEQIPLTLDQVEDAIRFMKEETMATVRFFKGKAFSVEAPNFVVLEVTQTEPGFKGDTTSNTTKPATLETGYQIAVPLFVNIGDKILSLIHI